MKIKIEHIPNTYNYGSLMMAINIINILNEKFSTIDIYVDSISDDNFNRIKQETKANNLKKMYSLDKLGNSNKINRKLLRIKKEAQWYDARIILGGDDISEYYGKRQWLIQFPLMSLSSMKLKTFLVGQTIGPFTSYRKILAKNTLNKIKIYTRDDNCLEYLKSLGVKTAIKGRDLAFLDLPAQKDAKNILNKYKLLKGNYITVVPSGLIECYTKNREFYINEQIEIIKKILNNDKLDNKKVVLLPHVLKPHHVDDRLVIMEIMKNIDEMYLPRIIAIDDSMLASEAREILGNGLFTITGRMHAAVSTFYMRRPAISLSYSVKYAGVIGDGLDMNELVIESADDKLWENGEISKLVDEKVNFVINNYDVLIEKIEKNVSKTSKIVEEQLDDLVKELKKIEIKKLEGKKHSLDSIAKAN